MIRVSLNLLFFRLKVLFVLVMKFDKYEFTFDAQNFIKRMIRARLNFLIFRLKVLFVLVIKFDDVAKERAQFRNMVSLRSNYGKYLQDHL